MEKSLFIFFLASASARTEPGSAPLTSEQQFTSTLRSGAFSSAARSAGKRILDLFEPHLVRPVLKVHVLRVHFSEPPELHALNLGSDLL